ncbi:DUF1731 domain-containing protein [Vibrio fortis]|uniref:DUF1731 domain-containing protein n=1 Tax=Vibrio fortis TaxID=212667 RepID=A0A5N3SD02_9VIBR|nr:DUF1731 domain-containing protein [Vibrio fortis]
MVRSQVLYPAELRTHGFRYRYSNIRSSLRKPK